MKMYVTSTGTANADLVFAATYNIYSVLLSYNKVLFNEIEPHGHTGVLFLTSKGTFCK